MEELSIEHLAIFQKGFAFKSSDYRDRGIRIIKVSNLNQQKFDNQSCVFIQESLAKEYSRYELSTDDIVISTVGSWVNNPESVVGKVARIPSNIAGSLLNQNAVRLRANDKILQKYLYYALSSNYFRNYIIGTAQGSANQASITLEDIRKYSFLVPSIPTQNKIVEILSSLDDKIELNRQINDNLEQQAQALFKSWFVDFEPFKDGEFVDSELGMIPKGWKIGELGEIAEFKRGKTITQKDTVLGCIPVIAGGVEPAYYHNKANTSAPVVTISASGANAGYTQILFEDVWASDCSFIDSTCDYLLFAYCFLSINSRILRHAQVGAAQPHVYAKDVNAFALPIPNDTNIIKQFILHIEPMFEMIGNLRSEIKEFAQLRDTLLPRLMSGELKINEINC